MQEVIIFITQQFFNIITFLDSIEIYGALTLFRVLMISFLLVTIFRFLGGYKND